MEKNKNEINTTDNIINNNSKTQYSITFMVDDNVYNTITTAGNENLIFGKIPTKEKNTFIGWYRDRDVWQEEVNENTFADIPLTENIKVYARFSDSSITIDDITYKLYLRKYIVEQYHQTATSVTLQEEINGIPVSVIGDRPFFNCESLIDITIPNSITYIRCGAFHGCKSLTNVYYQGTIADWCKINFEDYFSNPMEFAKHFYLKNESGEFEEVTEIIIPDGVTEIKARAFYGFKDVTKVVIPDSVTGIGDYAFAYCSSLTSVIIADGIINISKSAFDSCSSLQFNQYDNALYLGNSENLYLVLIKPINNNITTCNINDNTKIIAGGAFEDCSSLTNITIPDSVTYIGDDAFDGCSGLTSITIPNGVTGIGDGAFDGCDYLTSITIPGSVTRIGYNAFFNCRHLTSITIPDSVTRIGAGAFENCKKLTNVYFENPNNWIADNTPLSSSDLSDSETAAELVRQYCVFTWTRQ